jgi:hypothetical protein
MYSSVPAPGTRHPAPLPVISLRHQPLVAWRRISNDPACDPILQRNQAFHESRDSERRASLSRARPVSIQWSAPADCVPLPECRWSPRSRLSAGHVLLCAELSWVFSESAYTHACKHRASGANSVAPGWPFCTSPSDGLCEQVDLSWALLFPLSLKHPIRGRTRALPTSFRNPWPPIGDPLRPAVSAGDCPVNKIDVGMF